MSKKRKQKEQPTVAEVPAPKVVDVFATVRTTQCTDIKIQSVPEAKIPEYFQAIAKEGVWMADPAGNIVWFPPQSIVALYYRPAAGVDQAQ